MKMEPFVDRGIPTEDNPYPPTTMGTVLIAESEAEEILLQRMLEADQARQQAWIDSCLKELYL